MLALMSEKSRAESSIDVLKAEVMRLQQGLSEDEQTYVSAMADQEGYTLPESDKPTVIKGSLGDGLLEATSNSTDSIESPAQTLVNKLGGEGKDPIDAIFSLMFSIAPLVLIFSLLIIFKAVTRD